MICFVDLEVLQRRLKLLLIRGLSDTGLNLHLCKIGRDGFQHSQNLGAAIVCSRVAGIPSVRLSGQLLQELPVFLSNLARTLVELSEYVLRVCDSSLRFLRVLDIDGILFAILSSVRFQLRDVGVQILDVGVVVSHLTIQQFDIGSELVKSVVQLRFTLSKLLFLLFGLGHFMVAPIFVLLFLLLLVLQLEDHLLNLLFHLVKRTTGVLAMAGGRSQGLSCDHQAR
mmetsp:Transcript_21384/g.51880  ORF Transcript_21384/g.51880 Transcript_21384/m.51880 type:complete len:226 (-) Transcript_21384:1240-1917(-)